MLIERNASGSFTAFQRMQCKTEGVKKMGFICEADSPTAAMIGVVQVIAAHCAVTLEHPATIIEKVQLK